MSSHTPGPWEVRIERGINCIRPSNLDQIGYTGGYAPIAKVCGDKRLKKKEADARLIAAAPDLLEALQRMLAKDVPLTGAPSHDELVEFWEREKLQGRGDAEDVLFALAVIAKATGK